MIKVISHYLRLLCTNQYAIDDTQKSPNMPSPIPPSQHDKEDVSFEVDSMLTNVPIEKRVNHIIEKIYLQKKLTPILFETDCQKSIVTC